MNRTCKLLNMTLAQIESAEENDALRVALGDLHLNGHDYWIGLERAQSTGKGSRDMIVEPGIGPGPGWARYL